MVFILYIYQHVQSELTEKNQVDHQNKQLEKRHEKEISNVYSSSKANEFLSYDRCMQRMKCPVSRKEECSEECQAGNTEEEIEEHIELTIDEHRNTINKKPKPRFEININTKKRSKKNKYSLKNEQQLNTSTNQSTIKNDL